MSERCESVHASASGGRTWPRVQFLDGKNKANRANMEMHMPGATDAVLTRLLRGLSGAKVTKQGSFRGHDGASSWLGCSCRNDAGARAVRPRTMLGFRPAPRRLRAATQDWLTV